MLLNWKRGVNCTDQRAAFNLVNCTDLHLPGETETTASAASIAAATASSSIVDDPLVTSPKPAAPRAAAPPWATSPSHGIAFDSSWALLDDLEILVKCLRSKQLQKSASLAGDSGNNNNNFDSFSEAGWSREMGPDSERRVVLWDETSRDYLVFVKEVTALRGRADGARSRDEALDNHMALGRALYEHHLFRDALISFRRACELRPTDVRAHFRAGNTLYALGRHAEAKEEFLLALEAAEAGGAQSADILPQIHVFWT